MLTHRDFKEKMLGIPAVKAEFSRLEEEFAILDEFLKIRTAAGLTQAKVAERMGTTQSAIARLESGHGRNSPSLSTLRKYARALGLKLEFRISSEERAPAINQG